MTATVFVRFTICQYKNVSGCANDCGNVLRSFGYWSLSYQCRSESLCKNTVIFMNILKYEVTHFQELVKRIGHIWCVFRCLIKCFRHEVFQYSSKKIPLSKHYNTLEGGVSHNV